TSAVAHCYPQRGAPAFVFSHTSLQLFVQPAVSFDSTLALFTITARTRRENCGTSRTEVSHEPVSSNALAAERLAALCRRLHPPNLQASAHPRRWSAARDRSAHRHGGAASSGPVRGAPLHYLPSGARSRRVVAPRAGPDRTWAAGRYVADLAT